MNESLQSDVDMLRAQLAMAEEIRAKNECEIGEQRAKISEIHTNYQTQTNELEADWQSKFNKQKASHDTKENEMNDLLHQQQIHNETLNAENVCLKEQLSQALTDKDNLQKEVMGASDYIVAVQEKCYQSNQQSLDLLENLKDAEDEIEVLKNYIIDLKSRIAVYIPQKGDTTDKKLAEYINNYPDRQKLKIMFLRESEGVYEFGSRRVMVKVERDKIQIKVGGGYLSIDEFLD